MRASTDGRFADPPVSPRCGTAVARASRRRTPSGNPSRSTSTPRSRAAAMTCRRNVRSPLSQSARPAVSNATRRGFGSDSSRRPTSSLGGRRTAVVHAPDSRTRSVEPPDASSASPAGGAGATVAVMERTPQFSTAVGEPSWTRQPIRSNSCRARGDMRLVSQMCLERGGTPAHHGQPDPHAHRTHRAPTPPRLRRCRHDRRSLRSRIVGGSARAGYRTKVRWTFVPWPRGDDSPTMPTQAAAFEERGVAGLR